MLKILLYLMGILLISVGIFLTILDLNVLTLEYSFLEFVQFISRRSEMFFILIGFMCLFLSLERKIFNELCLRCHLKLERKRNTRVL